MPTPDTTGNGVRSDLELLDTRRFASGDHPAR
jgi:hypothetical protein